MCSWQLQIYLVITDHAGKWLVLSVNTAGELPALRAGHSTFRRCSSILTVSDDSGAMLQGGGGG